MSDAFWQYFFGAVGLISLALIQVWSGKKTQAAIKESEKSATAASSQAAAHAVEVKDALVTSSKVADAKLAVITDLSEKTHALVNSAMGTQLRLVAQAARALADIKPTPENLTAAATAERLLREHQVKQTEADTKGKGTGFHPGEPS